MIACIMGDVQLAELLLARGASIHNTDKESKLLLSLAFGKLMQAIYMHTFTIDRLELAFHGRLNSISSISEIPRVLIFHPD